MSTDKEYTLEMREWNDHWMDIVSADLVMDRTFEEWVFCPDRYGHEELTHLEQLYNQKRRILLLIGS